METSESSEWRKRSLYGVKVLDVYGDGFDDVTLAAMGRPERMQIASMSLGRFKGNDSLKAAVEGGQGRRDFDRRSR